MIDNLSILLSHILIALAFYNLLSRDDLDHEEPPIRDKEPDGFAKKKLSPSAKNRRNGQINANMDDAIKPLHDDNPINQPRNSMKRNFRA